MGIIATLIVGLIAGALASYIMKSGGGIVMDMILGIVGAFVGGLLGSLLGFGDLTSGFNLTTIIVATIGAIIVIAVMRAIRR